MSLWDCFKALAEGFVAQPVAERPVGLSNIRATSDDDLLNQLSNPVGGASRYWSNPSTTNHQRSSLKPTMAFAHLHRPVMSGYEYFAAAAHSPVTAFSR